MHRAAGRYFLFLSDSFTAGERGIPPSRRQTAYCFCKASEIRITLGISFYGYARTNALTASTMETMESRETNRRVSPFRLTRQELLSY